MERRSNSLLEQELEKTVQELKCNYRIDADIKISLYSLSDRLEAGVLSEKAGWAASLIKLPIMISVLQSVEIGELSLSDYLPIDHRFTLEPYDYISSLPEGVLIPITDLLMHMISMSDNEAANILIDKVGIQTINYDIEALGLEKTRLGHLLCYNVPRYLDAYNLNGDNLTSPYDMVRLMRHIYDEHFSDLSKTVREQSRIFLSDTTPVLLNQGRFRQSDIRAKIGIISDPVFGDDLHEVGIIDNDIIICIMLNKINQNNKKTDVSTMLGTPSYSNSGLVFEKLLETVSKYI